MSTVTEDGAKARGIIATILAGALLAIILALVFFEPKPGVEQYLTLLIGALIANVAAIVQFYFGSSSGSKVLAQAQTDLLSKTVTGTGSGLVDAAPTGKPDDPVAVTQVDIDPTAREPQTLEEALRVLRSTKQKA